MASTLPKSYTFLIAMIYIIFFMNTKSSCKQNVSSEYTFLITFISYSKKYNAKTTSVEPPFFIFHLSVLIFVSRMSYARHGLLYSVSQHVINTLLPWIQHQQCEWNVCAWFADYIPIHRGKTFWCHSKSSNKQISYATL